MLLTLLSGKNTFYSMYRRNRSFLRPLLLMLMLVVGPFQAKTLFACAKIEKTDEIVVHHTSDVTKHNTSLCNDHQDCINFDFDNILVLDQNPCCEQSVVLSINQDLQQNMPSINSVVESDIDPPQMTATTLDLFLPSQTIAVSVVLPRINSSQSGSNTYLITQRLRI